MRIMSRILLLSILLLGCSGQFSSRFVNFNAYYNTFYNAQLSYGQGYTKSTEQSRSIIFCFQSGSTKPPWCWDARTPNTIDKGADIWDQKK